MLGASNFLVMVKDIEGLCLIVIGEAFFQLINCYIVL